MYRIIKTLNHNAVLATDMNDNQEYIYLPGGEVGSDTPCCVFESKSGRQDLPLDKAVEQAKRLHLKPVAHPEMGRRSY